MIESTYDRPLLYDKQHRAFFNDSRIACCEASTKSGKTHGCMAWLFEQCLMDGKPGRNYWWVAPVYLQAKIAYRRLKDAIPVSLRHANDSELSLKIIDCGTIWFKSAEKPDNLFGEDVYAAVIDEASRMRAEAWYAIRSTLTHTRGPVRIIGNVRGRSNWFFKLCRRAEGGDEGMSYMKITAQDAVEAGVLDKDEIEGAKRDLPEAVFNELYMADPSDSGVNPFGYTHIKACTDPAISSMPPIGFGIDLAKSVDWTVSIGLDSDMVVSRFDRFQKPWKDTVPELHRVNGKTPALVDSTGVGDPVLEALQDGGRSTQYEGLKFSSQSKQMLMEGLAVAIQQQKIRFPDGIIRTELEAFEYEYTRTGVRYSAPEGVHDDCVIALALAWRKCSFQAGISPQARKGARTGRAVRRNPGARGHYERSQY